MKEIAADVCDVPNIEAALQVVEILHQAEAAIRAVAAQGDEYPFGDDAGDGSAS